MGADPFCLPFKYLEHIGRPAHEYLSNLQKMNFAARITNVMNKSVEQLIAHHTNAAQLTGRFIDIKPQVLATLRNEIDHLDDRRAARASRMKMTL